MDKGKDKRSLNWCPFLNHKAVVGHKTQWKGEGLLSQVSSSETETSNTEQSEQPIWICQAKTENMAYPWPNVSLVTLGEKQENNNCQQLLALYMHTEAVM